jgi:death-on-curing protein
MRMIKFLTLSEALLILDDQIKNYGGIYGIRDINLLSSAIYMPVLMEIKESL